SASASGGFFMSVVNVDRLLIGKINERYTTVLEGLRTTLAAGKALGDALIEAKQQKGFKSDKHLFAWVKAHTNCKVGDTTLANYKRTAEEWADLSDTLGEKELMEYTFAEVVKMCRKHKRTVMTP